MTSVDVGAELDLSPLTGTTGASVLNLDLRSALSEGQLAAIHQALAEYKVLFFPGQHLNPDQHLAFARQLGEPTNAHPVDPGTDGYRELHEINYTKLRDSFLKRQGTPQAPRRPRADGWHSDVSFVRTPPSCSILNAIAMPEHGGDTVFANTQLAYERLSAPVRSLVDQLDAVHDGSEHFSEQLRSLGRAEWDGETYTEFEPVEHPVVRTHPVNGKRCLFVNPEFTQYITGVSRRESDAILDLLYRHMIDHNFVARYHWQAGDIGIWDNRSAMHNVIIDYGDAHRHIQRITLKGERPF